MAKLPTTELEKSSLEAHVDLCAMRYAQLDDRLSNLETKVGSIHEDILEGKRA
jgi:predicted nuclease with TOPRIM domain